MEHFDVIIIGAGASGLMCARVAGQRGLKVLVLEQNPSAGKKILISGGGKCNFTNLIWDNHCFLSSNKHFYKSALSQYPATEFIKLVEQYNIPFYEKKLGQLFCHTSAKDILNMLLAECEKTSNVQLLTNVKDITVEKDKDSNTFIVKNQWTSKNLVVASGGLAYPKLGGSSFGLDLARQFGYKIVTPFPALVPFLMPNWGDVAGISIKAKVTCKKIQFHEEVLCTHKGLSGPAILKISLFWNPDDVVYIDWHPDEQLPKTITNLRPYFPARFCEFMYQIANEQSKSLYDLIHHFECRPTNRDDFNKAEVMGAGVDVHQISSKTMEGNLTKGLYFIGEVVDVTGLLGGYNFQWAWSSGFACGQHL